MTRRALAVGVFVLGLPAAAAAQQPAPDMPDVAAGDGVIRGRVVHPEHPERTAELDVVLYALSRQTGPGVRRTTTDADGRFVFQGVSTAEDTAYLLGVRYAGIPFVAERVAFAPGENERRVELRVSEPNPDGSRVTVAESRLRLEWVGAELQVSEAHRLANPDARTVYVPPDRRSPVRAAFRTRLPRGAAQFRVPLGMPPEGLVQSGEQVAFYGPVYPGEQELGFSYVVPGASGDRELRRVLPTGAGRVVVQTPEGGPKVRVAGLAEGPILEEGGQRFLQLEGAGLAPGATLALQVERPPTSSDRSRLQGGETRIFLELDGSALLVREEHGLEVEGNASLVGSPEAPLLRIPVPVGARELRFDRASFALGLVPTDGGAALLGPLPPGASRLELSYQIPASGGPVQLERRFALPVELLSVYVADTGIEVDSERLHRRRPVRTPDRTFLHLEGFQIAADEAVSVALATLPPRGGLSRTWSATGVAGVAALVVLYLVAPLRREAPAAEPTPAAAPDVAREEREALYASIHDLEHDYETGKLTEADYRTLRQELRARAVALLRYERRGAAAEPEPRAARAPACPACAAQPQAGDRFCAACGAPLAGDARRERGASA